MSKSSTRGKAEAWYPRELRLPTIYNIQPPDARTPSILDRIHGGRMPGFGFRVAALQANPVSKLLQISHVLLPL